jgi:ribosomal protein S18 acetylase RimI-like enzyme
LQKPVPPSFALRASQSSDAGLFYAVTEQTMRAHVIAAGGAWDEERSRREAAEDSINPEAKVIMTAGAAAGILLVERPPHELYLRTLYLLPSQQGRGIGRSLVFSLQQEAVARRVPLCLHVLKVNPAKRFYERMGFKVEEETEYLLYMRYAT